MADDPIQWDQLGTSTQFVLKEVVRLLALGEVDREIVLRCLDSNVESLWIAADTERWPAAINPENGQHLDLRQFDDPVQRFTELEDWLGAHLVYTEVDPGSWKGDPEDATFHDDVRCTVKPYSGGYPLSVHRELEKAVATCLAHNREDDGERWTYVLATRVNLPSLKLLE